MKEREKRSALVFGNPINLLIILVALIFGAEVLVARLLSMLFPSFMHPYPLMDAGMLAAVLSPVVYYLVVKPFAAQIQELKRSEEALQASEERYRSIVESTDDSIYLVDSKYCYVFMNKKHVARMGFSGGEYVGRCFSEFHSQEETRDFIEKIDHVFEEAKSIHHGHQSERDNKYFLRTFSPVKGLDGKVVAVSVISKRASPH